MKKRTYSYLIIVLTIYAAFTVLFTMLPRSTFSALEKRELATFPPLTLDSLAKGFFTNSVSQWFSDSEPYRDNFMTMSMWFSDNTKLRMFHNNQSKVKFHAADSKDLTEGADVIAAAGNRNIDEYDNQVNANANAKVAHHGIIIAGEGANVRALMAYGGAEEGGVAYAKACNEYQRTFPNIKVYCMLVPTAGEFYCPDAAKEATKPELPTIQAIHDRLSDSVKVVNAYSALAAHVKEPIYLRTDHHWAPLGAFYAAQAFARVANVPFKELNSYDKKVIHNFVGTMYGFSRDISVKNAPEDFVYYVPRGVTYTTDYIHFKTNGNFQTVGEGPKVAGEYFYSYPDGSGAAYSTFMGGDAKITHVNTSTKNGRRLLIIKDSFGNAIPGYLFYSFEDIHVVDFRYFSKNMKKYVTDNNITDILMFSEIFRAYASGQELINFLTQPDGTYTAKGGGKKDAADNKKPAKKRRK